MIQLRVYGTGFENWLDLYEEEPIKITLQFDDFNNQDTLSSYSRAFRVPNTRTNAQFFKSVFMVDGLDFDVTKKTSADLLVNGALFREGHIRLQKIFVNKDQDKIEYEILFLGEVRDFASAVGDATLCQLDLSALNHVRSFENIAASWGAYPSEYGWNNTTKTFDPQIPSINSGLLNGNVIYPLIDHGNTYDDVGATLQTRIALTGATNFTQNSAPLLLDRFKPMIRAKYVMDKIFENAGFSYTSSVFASDIFQKVYVSAFGNEASPYIDDAIEGYTITARVDGAWFNETTSTVQADLVLNGTTILASNWVSASSPSTNFNFNLPLSATYNMQTGDTVEVHVYILGDGSNLLVEAATSYFQIVAAPGINNTMSYALSADTYGDQNPILWDAKITDPNNNYNPATGRYTAPVATSLAVLFQCDYHQMDFLQDILKLGRLVMVPDRTNPRNFIIETWDEYIGGGDVYDWSHKLDHVTDIEIEPLFYTQKANHEFMYSEDGDYINEYHQKAYKHTYGYILIESNNELIVGTETTKLGIAATPVTQVDGAPDTSTFIIPHIHVQENTDYGVQSLPIKPVTRVLFYNGLKDSLPSSQQWYIYDDGAATNRKLAYFPMVSMYSDFPLLPTTLRMTWSNDIAYFGNNVPGVNPNLGNAMYNVYWSNYIGEVYNSTGRILRAYFILDDSDITNITFDDVVFVNGAWYRVNKIQDAPVGQSNKVPVLVELVKLINYKPAFEVDITPGDFTGDLPVEDGSGTFGDAQGDFGGSQNPSYTEYYLVQNCNEPFDTKVASYNSILFPGNAVMLTGSGNVGKCYTVVNAVVGPIPATPIVLTWPTCEICNLELNP